MRNHGEKTRNIQRSVLPSTARKRARDERRRIHKAQRTRQRAALRTFGEVADPHDFDPDFREGKRRSATEWMVLDRRSADKIGPLTRWAVAIVRTNADLHDAPLHEQVAYFAALLPTDLIGRHAVQHIEWAIRYHLGTAAWIDGRKVQQERLQRHRELVADQVRRLIAAGEHATLNRALRRTYRALAVAEEGIKSGPSGRLLVGAHDVEEFATAVATSAEVRKVIADLATRWA